MHGIVQPEIRCAAAGHAWLIRVANENSAIRKLAGACAVVEVEDIGNVITAIEVREGGIKQVREREVVGRVDITVGQLDFRPWHVVATASVAGVAAPVALVRIARTVDLTGADMETGTAHVSRQHFIGGRNRPRVSGHREGPDVGNRHRICLFHETIDQHVRVGPGKQQVREGTGSADRRHVVGFVRRDGLRHAVDGQSGRTRVERGRPVFDIDHHVVIRESVAIVYRRQHSGNVRTAGGGLPIRFDRRETGEIVDERFGSSG